MKSSQKSEARSRNRKEFASWGMELWISDFLALNAPFYCFALRDLLSGLRSSVFGLRTWYLVIFGLFLGSCNSGTQKALPVNKSDEAGVAKFVVSEEIHNFGSLKAGEIVTYTFVFRNDGTKTLTIEQAVADCGCTEINIPEKNIAPGKEGHIEVTFNSAGEVGKVLKTITITSNAEATQRQLFIRANVSNELIEIYS
jgi:hypothetical protein